MVTPKPLAVVGASATGTVGPAAPHASYRRAGSASATRSPALTDSTRFVFPVSTVLARRMLVEYRASGTTISEPITIRRSTMRSAVP